MELGLSTGCTSTQLGLSKLALHVVAQIACEGEIPIIIFVF